MQQEMGRPSARPARFLAIAAAAVILVAAAIYGLRGNPSLEGRAAPGFTLERYDGATVSLASLRGQVVVLNFWASWCEPCQEEAPALERVWRAYRARKVAFVGVNGKDVPKGAAAFIARFDLTYPNGPDPYDRISHAYRVFGFPETYVIDAEGRVVWHHIGAIDEHTLQVALDDLLSR